MSKEKIINTDSFFRFSTDYERSKDYDIKKYVQNNLGYDITNKVERGYPSFSGKRIDVNTIYKINNFGFRDEDWNGLSESIAVGCSNTFGVGVPAQLRWSNILSEMNNQKIINLSHPGASIHELVLQLFAYFKTFGNPKNIFCLFPDPFRTLVPNIEGLITVDGSSQAKSNVHLGSLIVNDEINKRPKYFKRPFNYQDILPLEFPLFFSMMSIHTLEQYCNSNNINLIWSSWDQNFQHLIVNNNVLFDNFILDKNLFDNRQIRYDCHTDKKNNNSNYIDYFDNGQDIENGFYHSHPGHHWHIHVAEIFYKAQNNKT